MVVVAALAVGVCGCRYKKPDVIVDKVLPTVQQHMQVGGVNFVEVDGESQLPLEFMQTGQNRGSLEPVRFAKYWIAEKPISKALFASVMGKSVDNQSSEEPMEQIEWAEAEAFCKRFTELNRAKLPENCIVSLPTMMEWAHAVTVLKGKINLVDAQVGTFLFTGTPEGGYLHTMWGDILSDRPNVNPAIDLLIVPKRCKLDEVGLQPILLNVTNQWDETNLLAIRGLVAMQHGEFAVAAGYLQTALKSGSLSEEDKVEAEEMLATALEEPDKDFEDWSGLVAVSAAFAEQHGYVTEPFASSWKMKGWEECDNPNIATAYENLGIKGKWMRIGDLPKELQKDQLVVEDYHLMIQIDEEFETAELRIEPDFVVQTLECDFDGDGQKDFVTEDFGSVGSDGYWYSFYRGLPNGSYTNVLKQQVVGLCALPHKNGKGCGFLVVEKEANPVLVTSLLSFRGGEPVVESANPRSFYMLDASEDWIYRAAPFIGAGYGLGWAHLRARGQWYRPLYWSWESGTVQGFSEGYKQVQQKLMKKSQEPSGEE